MSELKNVHNYTLRYDEIKKQPSIVLHYMENGRASAHVMQLTAEEALYVSDMLRNEKPVRYNRKRNLLLTGLEPTGEEETP